MLALVEAGGGCVYTGGRVDGALCGEWRVATLLVFSGNTLAFVSHFIIMYYSVFGFYELNLFYSILVINS